MKLRFRLYVVPLTLLALAGCASQGSRRHPSRSTRRCWPSRCPNRPSPSKSSPSLNRWRCRRS